MTTHSTTWALDRLRVDDTFTATLPAAPLDGLRTDVERRGILVPLLVTADGLLLDGHRRLTVARELDLSQVPVLVLDFNDVGGWHATVARAVNLHRRHLNAAQRVALGTSLERIEREAAKGRRAAGVSEDGKAGGRGRTKPYPHGGGRVSARHANEATARVAAAADVSRNTYERTRAVLDAPDLDPEIKTRLLTGKISVAGAHGKLRRSRAAAAPVTEPTGDGLYRDLTAIPRGRYKTLYADPPWQYEDKGCRGAAEQHYGTLSVNELAALPIPDLAHPEGSHLWLWTTWPMIRDQAPHCIINTWGFRWVGEVVWRKPGMGIGRWLRPTTEVLVLAVRGNPPVLVDDQPGFLEADVTKHSAKPAEARLLVERCSPGPRLELFARSCPTPWEGWGDEVTR